MNFFPQNKLLEYLVCPCCMDSFNIQRRVPRNFVCGHTICEACLKCLIKDSIDNKLACIICAKTTEFLPRNNMAAFSKNFRVADAAEVYHRALAENKPPEICTSHGEGLEYFCASPECTHLRHCCVKCLRVNHVNCSNDFLITSATTVGFSPPTKIDVKIFDEMEKYFMDQSSESANKVLRWIGGKRSSHKYQIHRIKSSKLEDLAETYSYFTFKADAPANKIEKTFMREDVYVEKLEQIKEEFKKTVDNFFNLQFKNFSRECEKILATADLNHIRIAAVGKLEKPHNKDEPEKQNLTNGLEQVNENETKQPKIVGFFETKNPPTSNSQEMSQQLVEENESTQSTARIESPMEKLNSLMTNQAFIRELVAHKKFSVKLGWSLQDSNKVIVLYRTEDSSLLPTIEAFIEENPTVVFVNLSNENPPFVLLRQVQVMMIANMQPNFYFDTFYLGGFFCVGLKDKLERFKNFPNVTD